MPHLCNGVNARFCWQMTMDPKPLIKSALYQIGHRLAQKAQSRRSDRDRALLRTGRRQYKFLYWLYSNTPWPCPTGGQGS